MDSLVCPFLLPNDLSQPTPPPLRPYQYIYMTSCLSIIFVRQNLYSERKPITLAQIGEDMVGIFSRFSVGRGGHRRTQSALDERQVSPPTPEVSGTTGAGGHGIELAVEFKPLEHPIEPLDNNPPIQCPLPEPSILNDGRIWKERVSAGMRRRGDLPVMKEGGALESEAVETKPRPTTNRLILPSVSAPEHNLLKLLEECNASGI